MHATSKKSLDGLETLNLDLSNASLEIEHLKYASTAAVLITYGPDNVVVISLASAGVIYVALEVFVTESLHLGLQGLLLLSGLDLAFLFENV